MVDVILVKRFEVTLSTIKDLSLRRRVLTQLAKIRANPKVGKPMRHHRRGTRELRVKPFRLTYRYVQQEGLVYILDLYHKKKQ